jgi:hypothetical protein
MFLFFLHLYLVKTKKVVPQMGRNLLHSYFTWCTTYNVFFQKKYGKTRLSLVVEWFFSRKDNILNETRAKLKLKNINRTLIPCLWPEILAHEKTYFSATARQTFAAPTVQCVRYIHGRVNINGAYSVVHLPASSRHCDMVSWGHWTGKYLCL